VTDALALAGIAGTAWFFVSVDEYVPWLYRGGFLAFAAIAAVAICCAARPGSWVGRALDVQPLAWIGRRSYGIYLWHWPVFVVTRPLIDVQGPQWLVDIARTGLAVALAAVSYRYLETPVRAGTFAATLRRGWVAWCELAARRAVAGTYDGDRRSPGRRRFAHHGLVPALAVGCVAVLVSAHLASVQQPVWAASMPATALPIPGVVPDLPGGVSGRLSAPAVPGKTSISAPTKETAATSFSSELTDLGRSRSSTASESRPTAATGTTTPATHDSQAVAGKDASAGTTSALPAAAGPAPAAAKAPATTARKIAPSAPAPSSTAKPAAPATKKAAATAVSSVKLSAFGDSVLLGASTAVRGVVGSMSLDAVVGRQAWDTLADVTAAHQAKKLAPVVLIHTGNNGVISPDQLASTLAGLKDRAKVVLVNDHVDRTWQDPNNKIISGVSAKYPNVVILDWNAAAVKNPGWFGPDGIHVNGTGAKAYASLVAATLG
jgi:hypothetical protein